MDGRRIVRAVAADQNSCYRGYLVSHCRFKRLGSISLVLYFFIELRKSNTVILSTRKDIASLIPC